VEGLPSRRVPDAYPSSKIGRARCPSMTFTLGSRVPPLWIGFANEGSDLHFSPRPALMLPTSPKATQLDVESGEPRRSAVSSRAVLVPVVMCPRSVAAGCVARCVAQPEAWPPFTHLYPGRLSLRRTSGVGLPSPACNRWRSTSAPVQKYSGLGGLRGRNAPRLGRLGAFMWHFSRLRGGLCRVRRGRRSWVIPRSVAY
jgi:hypothetical protein